MQVSSQWKAILFSLSGVQVRYMRTSSIVRLKLKQQVNIQTTCKLFNASCDWRAFLQISGCTKNNRGKVKLAMGAETVKHIFSSLFYQYILKFWEFSSLLIKLWSILTIFQSLLVGLLFCTDSFKRGSLLSVAHTGTS